MKILAENWKQLWHQRTITLALLALFASVAAGGGLIVALVNPAAGPVQFMVTLAAFVGLAGGGVMAAWQLVLHPAQQELITQEQRLRRMATVLPDRVVMLDANGLYYDVLRPEPEYDTALSARVGGTAGQQLQDLFPAAFVTFCIQKVRDVIATKQPQVFEYDLDVTGERFRIEGRVVPYTDPITGQTLAIWASRDVTERQRYEQRLLGSEQLLRSVFQALPDRTMIFDREGHYLEVLQAAYNVYYHPNIAFRIQTGDTIHAHFSPEFADFCMTMIHKTLDSGAMQVFTYLSPVHNPSRYFEARTIPFSDPGSQEARVLWMTRDITATHEAEEQRLALILQQEKLEFFQQFVNNITHDLKTPLTIIETGLYFVQKADDPARRQMRVDNMRGQVATLNSMIDDMLTISRLDTVPVLKFETLDLVSLLQETVQRLQPQVEKKQQHLITSLVDTRVMLPASRSELARALTNLIDNAIKYTPDKGQVKIDLNTGETEVVIKVHDTGIGIKPEDIPRIFDRFYRSETGRFTAAGTGLGLAIVKRIVELHGGHIEVESEPGQGSTFRVSLPVQAPSRAS